MPPFPGHSTSLHPRPLLRCLTPMHALSCWSVPCSSAQWGSFLFVCLIWFIPFVSQHQVQVYSLQDNFAEPHRRGLGFLPQETRSNHHDGDYHTVSSLSCSSVPLSSELEHRDWAFHFHLPGTEHISWGKMDLQLMFGEAFTQLNSCPSCFLLPSGHVLTSTPTLYYPLRREYQNSREGASYPKGHTQSTVVCNKQRGIVRGF